MASKPKGGLAASRFANSEDGTASDPSSPAGEGEETENFSTAMASVRRTPL